MGLRRTGTGRTPGIVVQYQHLNTKIDYRELTDLNITTDPRLLKQMLLTQWTTEINPFVGKSAKGDTEQSPGVFDLLLNQYSASSLQSDPSDSSILNRLDSSSALSAYPVYWGGALANVEGSTSAFDELIVAAGQKYGVSPALIKGVIQSESSFNPSAVSSAGAKGLMQLMDDTARGLGVTDSFDPAQNVDGGTRFLSYLLRKYDGNVATALAAYNAGPGRVDRLGLENDRDVEANLHLLPKETQGYIRKVLNATAQWSV